MNIIVCIKSVPISSAELSINHETNTIIREGMKNEINPLDLYAIEEALRIKEKAGGKVTVISMGIPSAEVLLKEALALGVDDAVLLSDTAFAGSDTLATAYVLSLGIRKLGRFDLILCGKQAIDGDTGQVGPGLAGKLGIPHTTLVKRIEEINANHIRCRRMIEGGYETVEMSLPALITVVKEINHPRLPTVKGVIKSETVAIKVFNAEDIGADKGLCGLSGSPTRVVKTFKPNFSIRTEMLEGSPEIQAKKLVDRLTDISARVSEKGMRLDLGKTNVLQAINEVKPQQTEKSVFEGIWIFCELKNGMPDHSVYELLGEGRRLAGLLGAQLSAVLLGDKVEEAVRLLIAYGADCIYMLDNPSFRDHNELIYTDILVQLLDKYKPEIFMIGATVFGRSLAPRIASRLNTGLTADCIQLDIDATSGILLQTRPALGGNIMATVVCPEKKPQMATIRPKVFKALEPDSNRAGKISKPDVILPENTGFRVMDAMKDLIEMIDIAEADIIVAIGRGISGPQNISFAEELAKLLGGTVGASRAVVDAGGMDYSRQIGQTGKTVNPKLYIACGISGAIQHIAGMSSADIIVAINTDPRAPIFKIADYGIIGDLNEVLPALINEFRKARG